MPPVIHRWFFCARSRPELSARREVLEPFELGNAFFVVFEAFSMGLDNLRLGSTKVNLPVLNRHVDVLHYLAAPAIESACKTSFQIPQVVFGNDGLK